MWLSDCSLFMVAVPFENFTCLCLHARRVVGRYIYSGRDSSRFSRRRSRWVCCGKPWVCHPSPWSRWGFWPGWRMPSARAD